MNTLQKAVVIGGIGLGVYVVLKNKQPSEDKILPDSSSGIGYRSTEETGGSGFPFDFSKYLPNPAPITITIPAAPTGGFFTPAATAETKKESNSIPTSGQYVTSTGSILDFDKLMSIPAPSSGGLSSTTPASSSKKSDSTALMNTLTYGQASVPKSYAPTVNMSVPAPAVTKKEVVSTPLFSNIWGGVTKKW